ncbi:MAG: hypothetical protein ACLSBB_14370 [Ruthenibacterium lactatiformans]
MSSLPFAGAEMPLAEQAPRAKAGTASVLAQLAGACARQTLCCKRPGGFVGSNNPFGFEVIDLRLSGLGGGSIPRRRMERFAR